MSFVVKTDIPMSLHSRRRETFVDGFAWACRICKQQRIVTVNSFFEGSHLTLVQLIGCIYWWSRNFKQSDTCVETGMSRKSVIEWQKRIRDICCQYLMDHPVQMGGPGRTVEID